ncbi:hypothetical protein GCM10009530_11490 [Microbispora corallina]|uniref:Protein kinase domain-containing protein n=1 Tax=Microbispora corallina TaxID=83302 RepID=A0ABQ4FTK7_9ACTN|nr:serine/threonine-protein kinase [Microbispora corallina]GIH38154.1 hypothetical protein Mco01_11540 [Microbispora corallina]
MVTPLEPDDPRALGEFRLSGRLGEGGQGIVYLGYAPSGEPVAVKVLKAGLDPGVRQRLAREIDAMRGVAPFCTARVLTAVAEGPRPYVVSEFIDGPSLQQRVAANGPLRGGELERLAVGTATALAAIHAAGIVHRDFKPGNVLLGPDGPRVVDFGIARQGESETITAGPIGTPAYLAPEQIAGRPATPASDVFAWGATIAYAAGGRAAFGADSVAAVMHRIMTTDPDLSAVPEPLRHVVGRCLAKDPSTRPAARDLLLELVGSSPDPLRAGAAAASSGPPGDPYGGRRSGQQGGPPNGPYGDPYGGPQGGAPGNGGGFGQGQPYFGAQGNSGRAAQPAYSGGTGQATGPAHPAEADTRPPAPRRSRAGLLVGIAAAVAALAVTAALLVPRLIQDPSGGHPSAPPSSAASGAATGSPAAPSPSYGTTRPATGGGTSQPATTGRAGTIPAAFAGTWRGHIVPTPDLIMGEHDVEITLQAGRMEARWAEPDDGCVGTLELKAVVADDSALALRLTAPGCVPGDVTLTRKGDKLAYRWKDDAGLVTYNGDLSKDG